MSDIDRKFIPKDAGFTKREIIDMINDRWDGSMSPWEGMREPDINKLTDERAQKFVDEWEDLGGDMLDAFIEGFGADEKAEQMEALVVALAVELQAD